MISPSAALNKVRSYLWCSVHLIKFCVCSEISEEDLNATAIEAVLGVDKERMDLMEDEKVLLAKPQVC